MSNRFIDKLNTLAPLGDEAIAAMERATTRPRTVAAKQDLIREGDRPGPMFVMIDGWACRYKIVPNGTRQIVGFLMPGDACDLHVGLLAEMDHSIRTLTRAHVATIDRATVDAILDRYPQIAKAMYISQLIDEGTMRAWITSMGRRSSTERVAHLICELYLRAKNVGMIVEPVFTLPLSQVLLADALGMTPVHLNRIVRELRLAGAMKLERGSVEITDPVKLAQLAGFDENYLHRRQRLAA